MSKVHVTLTREEVLDAQRQGIGLGDLIANITKKLGIKQCASCKRRQKQLNNLRLPDVRRKR